MGVIDEIKIETYLIQWLDEGYPEQDPFYARFGILETPEQEIALNEGLESQDLEWINFDENIFYWLCVHQGETIEEHSKEQLRNDWFYVGMVEVELHKIHKNES